MTDRVRTAGWASALVLGPVAAALFTATTAWATFHTPASPPQAVASTPAPADIQQALADDTARVAALEQLVASLRVQAAAIGATAPPTGRQVGAGTATAAPAPAVARPPSAVRRSAQPPAVHTVTGASSAKAAP
jgi:hypothetical protein